jgi:2,5-diamino-6-(ribosylamino)-4(3H)-pyrimidinone 5'-phosphate reductase
MLPRIIIYNAISLDGRVTGFSADLETYYQQVSSWKEDATLVSSQTILAAPDEVPSETEEDLKPKEINTADTRPLLVVVDSQGRIKSWHYLLKTPYWRAGVALCSQSTPAEHLRYLAQRNIDYIVTGNDHVDLRKALKELNSRYNIKTIRVDSGGVLNGILLRAGLVHEISVHIHPALVGGSSHHSFFHLPQIKSLRKVINLKLIQLEQFENGLVWIRYKVLK